MNSIVVGLSIILLCAANGASQKPTGKVQDVVFKLYDHNNPSEFSVLEKSSIPSFWSELFDADLRTKIYIHGWRASDSVIEKFREALLNAGDVNLIVVDWLKNARSIDYLKAKRAANNVSNVHFCRVQYFEFRKN